MGKDYFLRKTWFGAVRTVMLVSVLWSGAALAAGDSEIPESLKSWKGWVLHGQEAWLCPEVAGVHDRAFCAWPGELKLDVARQGGSMKFSQNWELQYEGAVQCSPFCADVPKVRLNADASQLKAVFVAHVEAATSLALPEPDERLTLRSARVNGEMRPVLRVGGENYIALPRGVHHVQLEYAFSGDSASLGFPIRPTQIEFGSAHWQVEGVDEERLLGETLNFTRVPTVPFVNQEGGNAAVSSAAQQFPPAASGTADENVTGSEKGEK